MDIQMQKICEEDRSVLSNLLEFYLYDFSEFEHTDVNNNGLFGYSYLDHYFRDDNRDAYFILADGKHAGFVLIHNHTLLKDTDIAIAEFFVMRKYRKRGVGRTVIREILNRYPTCIEIPVRSKNQEGLKFWKKITQQLNDIIDVTTESSPDWDGIILKIQKRLHG